MTDGKKIHSMSHKQTFNGIQIDKILFYFMLLHPYSEQIFGLFGWNESGGSLRILRVIGDVWPMG